MSQHPSPDDATAYRPPEETPTVVVAAGANESRPLMQLAPGTMLGDRYRIVSLIGRGGMGEVYRADDLKLGQSIAVKFLSRRAFSDPRHEQRLYEEVRIGRQISHPNVCRLYDITEVGSHLFITMEFVDGEDLASLLRRIGYLPNDKALSIARDLCAGLAAAHEKGVIHRDLKPGNVMVDGRGRARITDFGLAVAEETRGEQASAGTPAYMAPEQFVGEPASIQSDIYALGLILYEVFTGRRAFEARSLTDIVQRQRESRFARPSSIVSDIDPAAERVILRCLDPDPAERPQSAEAVAHELPYYDPLAAALAAGETPTPGMVADAQTKEDLSPAAAWALLAFLIVGLFAVAAMLGRTLLIRRVPGLKAPHVLLERVDQVLAAAGIHAKPADSAYFYNKDFDLDARGGDIVNARPAPILFHYRRSPLPMATLNGEHRVFSSDPPPLDSGMAEVIVDGTGRLEELLIVPPQREHPPTATTPLDWSPFFRSADLEMSRFTPVASEWAGKVESDEKKAWIASDKTRVEAASYHGRPVWFVVLPPWRKASRMDVTPPTVATRVTAAIMIVLISVLLFTAVLLARRNLMRGRGDRRSATRLSIFVLIVGIIGALFRAHHISNLADEAWMLLDITSNVLFTAVFVWITYLAVEPFIRKRWPTMLVTWTRLVNGRFTDPIVGRDLLIGGVAAIVIMVAWNLLASFVPAWIRGSAPVPLLVAITPLGELRHVAYFYGQAMVEALARGVSTLVFLVILRGILRSQRMAVAILFALTLIAPPPAPVGPVPLRIIFNAVIAAIALRLLLRYGLLALVSCAFALLVLWRIPITLDPNAWYFGRSSFTLLLLAAIGCYGFAIAMRGKQWLPRLALDEAS